MKKYKVFRNGTYLESYNRRYEAEDAVRRYQHMERMNAAAEERPVRYCSYEIRK